MSSKVHKTQSRESILVYYNQIGGKRDFSEGPLDTSRHSSSRRFQASTVELEPSGPTKRGLKLYSLKPETERFG